MSRNVFEIEQGLFGFATEEPAGFPDIDALTIGDFDAFSCQVTSGALEASPNSNDKTTPATWCEPESTESVAGVTSYNLNFTFLQDPHIVAGISRFLYEHDTETVWWFMGFNAADPPKATGKCTAVAGTIGGAARESLTFTVTLPVVGGKPTIAFGDETDSVIIGGVADTAVAGAPGHFTPSGSEIPANFAAMTGITASPTSAWTSGQYVVLGDASHAYWNATAWTVGTVALMADAEMAGAGASSGGKTSVRHADPSD